MKRYSLILTLILILTSVTSACNLIPGESNVPSGGVLFEDDFSDPSSGWDQIQTDEGITDYENGIYRIFIGGINANYWTSLHLKFSDSIITVDATKVAGPDDNFFGVLCRYQDIQNFYFFIISSDGYYGIGKQKDSQQSLISSDNLLPSEEIYQGEATNRIQAACTGNVLSLSVNDQAIGQTEDNDFTSGDVGLIAGTYNTGGTDIHFDNFRVLKP